MTSFDWGQAKQWAGNTFGFMCFMFVVVLVGATFIMWELPIITPGKLGLMFRAILVASAFMGFLGGIGD